MPDAAAPSPTTGHATSDAHVHEVLLVGAGFGGLGLAIQLDRMGIRDYRIVEREQDVGGTWHVNRYPGLAVDIASTTYSFSFEPNPFWSQLYAPGAELARYARHVADKYGLRDRILFGRSVEAARFDDADATWTLSLADGTSLRGRVLVLATGFLSQPKWPDIPGLERFRGPVIHTARWPDDAPVDGARVAVVGTGATSVQLIPELAPRVAHLDVYQRTPIWVAPKVNPTIPPALQRTFAAVPLTQRLARYATSSVLEVAMVSSALYHRELPQLARGAMALCRAHLARQVPDPALRAKLTPDYDFGCKRPTFSNDYFPTFLRPNVDLVTDGIDHVEEDAIVTRDGRRRPIDTLVLATGYKVWEKGNFPAFPVTGPSGAELGETWARGGYESYDGIGIHGFPNLFYLASPYAFTGLSYFFSIEGQMAHVARCLGEVRRRGARRFEPTAEAQRRFVDTMRARAPHTVFASGACGTSNSYYFNPHGEATLLRLTPTLAALHRAHTFPFSDYSMR